MFMARVVERSVFLPECLFTNGINHVPAFAEARSHQMDGRLSWPTTVSKKSRQDRYTWQISQLVAVQTVKPK